MELHNWLWSAIIRIKELHKFMELHIYEVLTPLALHRTSMYANMQLWLHIMQLWISITELRISTKKLFKFLVVNYGYP